MFRRTSKGGEAAARFRPAFFNARGQTKNRHRVPLGEMKAAHRGSQGRAGLETFRRAEETGQWRLIHGAHFDWWMFPIDDGSRAEYNVFSGDVAELRADAEYMQNYREGVRIALKSWGWDVERMRPAEPTGQGMGWRNWDVRLAKICRSLFLFEERELLKSCQTFARTIKPRGGFRYGGINLDELLHFPTE